MAAISRICATAVAYLVLGSALPAQRTWIVDRLGSGDFTDLPPAVQAAKAGDTVLVKPGGYTPATITKGIRLLGGNDVTLSHAGQNCTPAIPMVVSGVPAHEEFVMQGFRIQAVTQTTQCPISLLIVSGNQGRVHLAGLTAFSATGARTQVPAAIDVSDSPYVTMTNCTSLGGLHVLRSSVTVVGGSYLHYIPHPSVPGFGIVIDASRVTFAASQLSNGVALAAHPDHVLHAQSSVVALGEGTQLQAYLGSFSAAVGDSTSTLELDPRARLNPSGNAAPYAGFGAVLNRVVPTLVTGGGALGGGVDLKFRGAAGSVFLLMESLTAPPVSIPGFGEFWLDPQLLAAIAAGQLSVIDTVQLRIPVPNDTRLRGLAITFQALSGKWPTVSLSHPAVVVLQ